MLLPYFIDDWLILFDSCSYFTQNFNPSAEVVITIGKRTNEANSEIKTQPVTAEAKISKCST